MRIIGKLAEKIGVVIFPGGTVNIGHLQIGGESSRQEYHNRQILLNKVRNYWIKGVLEQSLHEQVSIVLNVEERLSAIARPWSLLLETANQYIRELPADTAVLSIFDQIGVGRTLLILGEPGSGKTITLLQLARDLINRAEQDEDQLIPVVFNLSSWRPIIRKNKSQVQANINDWLVEELSSKYYIPRKIGEGWVKNQQLLLLLDGLDEVPIKYRSACVAALNIFQQQQMGTELVVCCRWKDYESLGNQLHVQQAIYLRALTIEQIHHYLSCLSINTTKLSNLLETDTALQELAQSPLLLNLMVLAQEDIATELPPTSRSAMELQEHLLEAYIQKMLRWRGVDSRDTSEQTIIWLRWLAQRLEENAQSIFLIEQMQPNWLKTKAEQEFYDLNCFLISFLSVEFSMGLIYGQGAITGGVKMPGDVGEWLGILLGGGLIFELMIWGNALAEGEIRPVEQLVWSWRKASVGFLTVLGFWLAAMLIGVLMTLISTLKDVLLFSINAAQVAHNFLSQMPGLLVLGLVIGIIGSLVRGVGVSSLKIKSIPNQGIWYSARNMAMGWLIGGLCGAIFSTVFGGREHSLIYALKSGTIFFAPIAALWGAIYYGGTACVKHLSLRLVLCRNNHIPWSYAQFLDYATERVFLQKVGGGYIFVHRLLMEHFARMETQIERRIPK